MENTDTRSSEPQISVTSPSSTPVPQQINIEQQSATIKPEVPKSKHNKLFFIAGIVFLIGLIGGGYFLLKKTNTGNKPLAPNLSKTNEKPCTLESKICPDGTAVGRTGTNCEFAPCPKAENPILAEGNNNFKTYINSKRGYSLNYPSKWTYEELSTGGGANFKLADGTKVVKVQFFNKTNISLVNLKDYVLHGAVEEYSNFKNVNSVKEVVTDSNEIGYQAVWNYIPVGKEDLSVTEPISYFQSVDENSTVKIALLDSRYLSEYENIIKSFKTDKNLIVVPAIECVQEGETGNYFNSQQCCSGLIGILPEQAPDDEQSGCMPSTGNGGFICTKCEDGICGSGENRCNCSQDCK